MREFEALESILYITHSKKNFFVATRKKISITFIRKDMLSADCVEIKTKLIN
jgi:hypothetical protein